MNFYGFYEGMKRRLPLGSAPVFVLGASPHFLCATIIRGGVLCPGAQGVHCDFDLIVEAPGWADD